MTHQGVAETGQGRVTTLGCKHATEQGRVLTKAGFKRRSKPARGPAFKPSFAPIAALRFNPRLQTHVTRRCSVSPRSLSSDRENRGSRSQAHGEWCPNGGFLMKRKNQRRSR
jgi:hypothetical protein